MILRKFSALGSFIIDIKMAVMGIMELRGVLSSWATDEKNMERTLFEFYSNSLILVKSFMKTIVWLLSLINEAFTWR